MSPQAEKSHQKIFVISVRNGVAVKADRAKKARSIPKTHEWQEKTQMIKSYGKADSSTDCEYGRKKYLQSGTNIRLFPTG